MHAVHAVVCNRRSVFGFLMVVVDVDVVCKIIILRIHREEEEEEEDVYSFDCAGGPSHHGRVNPEDGRR